MIRWSSGVGYITCVSVCFCLLLIRPELMATEIPSRRQVNEIWQFKDDISDRLAYT